MSNILNNINDMRSIVKDMAKGMNILGENYSSILTIEEKMINIQIDVNDVRERSYMAQNLFERSFDNLGNIIMRIEAASSVSSNTENITKVGLDMSSYQGKNQATENVDNIRT